MQATPNPIKNKANLQLVWFFFISTRIKMKTFSISTLMLKIFGNLSAWIWSYRRYRTLDVKLLKINLYPKTQMRALIKLTE